MGRYLTNKLIGRGLLLQRLSTFPLRDYAVLAPVSQGYSPLEGRLPTCYSPVRHCTQGLLPFLVRLACVKRAASVDSEPGSNSRLILSSYQSPQLNSDCPRFKIASNQIFKDLCDRPGILLRKPNLPQASMPFRPHFAALCIGSGDGEVRKLRKLVKSFWKAYYPQHGFPRQAFRVPFFNSTTLSTPAQANLADCFKRAALLGSGSLLFV